MGTTEIIKRNETSPGSPPGLNPLIKVKNMASITPRKTKNSTVYDIQICLTKTDRRKLYAFTNKRIAVTNTAGIAQRVLIKDFSSFFGDEEEKTASTLLDKANAWLADNDINAPSVHVKVS